MTYTLPDDSCVSTHSLADALVMIEQETGLSGWYYSHYVEGTGYIFEREDD